MVLHVCCLKPASDSQIDISLQTAVDGNLSGRIERAIKLGILNEEGNESVERLGFSESRIFLSHVALGLRAALPANSPGAKASYHSGRDFLAPTRGPKRLTPYLN